jgi:hypothetical protein
VRSFIVKRGRLGSLIYQFFNVRAFEDLNLNIKVILKVRLLILNTETVSNIENY